MESSFLEDLLTREVDQNQVNALVGSLEDQLTAPRSSAAPSTTSISIKSDNITSISQLVSQSVPRKVTVTSVPINLSTAGYRYVKAPPISAQSNGSVSFDTKLLSKSNLASSHTSIPNNVIISSSPKPATQPVSRQPVSLIVNNNTVSSQVSIAPKITNTVPIAPRIGTNIMITPRHAQLLMAQRLGPNAALLQSNLIAQMPGGIPVVPRIPGSAIAVPPIMNTQIPGIRTVVGHRGPSIINMTQKTDPRMRINSQIPVSSLAQVKSNANIIPGQINYRFRQVNPSSSAVTSQVTTVNGVTPQAGAAANITVLKESVKRLKEFFQNLINLACGPNQPPEIGKMVKELVHNLMQGRVSEEEFIEKLQKTLKSDPQPNLVHFLKKTLPHLRDTIKKQQMQQMASKGPQQVISSSGAPLRPSLSSITGNRVPTVINGSPRITPHHILTNKNLTLQEQQMLQKQLAQHGRIVVASTGQVTPGMRTAVQGPIHGIASLTNKGFLTKPNMGASPAMLVASVNASKDKPRNTYYSSAVGGDDDINDVTCMAGVNLMEESQKILATGADFMSYQTRSIKDQPLIDIECLKSKIEQKVIKCGLQSVNSDALSIVSHALEERLRTLLERLTACSLHRNDPHSKEDVRYETISTVRAQLRVFEEIDEVERKHRESREREMLMRVAKSRSRTEDPEQARLKEKAKQMQLEEEELNRKRAANRTALEAIGGPRKKRKLDEALESLQKSQTPGNNSNSSSQSSSSPSLPSQGLRSRQNRITLRDLLFVLETEKKTCKSLILYRSFLR